MYKAEEREPIIWKVLERLEKEGKLGTKVIQNILNKLKEEVRVENRSREG